MSRPQALLRQCRLPVSWRLLPLRPRMPAHVAVTAVEPTRDAATVGVMEGVFSTRCVRVCESSCGTGRRMRWDCGCKIRNPFWKYHESVIKYILEVDMSCYTQHRRGMNFR